MRTHLRRLLLIALYLGCVQFALLAGIQNPGNPDDYERGRLHELVEGGGYRPFAYRTLLPSTVRLLLAMTPESAVSFVDALPDRVEPLAELFASTPAADERYPLLYLLAYGLQFACLLGFAVVLRSAIIHFYRPPPALADLVPLAALLLLPIFYRYITWHYDFPQLFLFALAYLLLARRAWPWFYAVLVLCALNKETAILLPIVHLLTGRSAMSGRAYIGHAAAQLGVLVAVRVFLQYMVFADLPGAAVEVHLARNLGMFLDPREWPFLFFHFAWVGSTSVVMPTNYNLLFLLLLPLVFMDWTSRPQFLKRSIWIVPLMFCLAMIIGQIDEMRVYYECYVVLALLAAGGVRRLVADRDEGAGGAAPGAEDGTPSA